jgi:hypothetical protein
MGFEFGVNEHLTGRRWDVIVRAVIDWQTVVI